MWFPIYFLAADCFLIAKATAKNVGCLKAIVEAYCSTPGQVVNFTKFQLMISPKTLSHIKSQIRSLSQINATSRVWKILGMPIVGKALSGSDCSFIEAKIIAMIHD